ncbi:F0F1 ATP synthase subunit delta [Streptococcus catagoni]|uniref:F0F1 ATP synthase subunit delta n=1 Tax=Streptococcus catagoni TaxID=2654874 RepID=UPI00140BB1DA|nr:F0F1 ATP synthase subunit delta [Streptococcus catagoni]
MTKKEQALVEQYAKSLVEVAAEHQVMEPLKKDVLAILEAFEATKLDESLSSLALPQDKKIKLVRLLKDTSSVYLNNFLEVIIQNQRENFLYEILQNVLKEMSKLTEEYDVYVTSAVPLTEEQKGRVKAVVRSKMGLKTGRLIEKVDPFLIGGFMIAVNNKIIDTSIKRQLHEFKMKLI